MLAAILCKPGAEARVRSSHQVGGDHVIPEYINPLQWHQAIGIARQSCARFFRDGGSAADAMRAFGVSAEVMQPADWAKAVEAIARVLCKASERRAA
jgi:hypothetical protein